MTRAKGIDVSHWQDTFKPEGLDFVIIKATEGYNWVDPKLDEHWTKAQTVPIRGAYHYFLTEHDPLLQAEHFAFTISFEGYHFLAVDYEAYNNVMDAAGEQSLRKFWLELERLTNLPIILYTTAYILRDNLCKYNPFWADVPFWVAEWNDGDDPTALGYDWVIWQWNGTGIDKNVYNGTIEEMKAWVKVEEEEVKKVYTSKTIIFSVLFALVNIAAIFGYAEFVPGDDIAQYVNIGVAVIVAILRFLTKEPVSI